MDSDSLFPFIDSAIASRLENHAASSRTLGGIGHDESFRLFNGFYEGAPGLVIDVYGRTLVIHDHANQIPEPIANDIYKNVCSRIDWIHTGVLKTPRGDSHIPKSLNRQETTIEENLDRRIKEHSIWYAIDLQLNRDASFYLDTYNLRKWLLENSQGKSVLNTFAYTGSLGVAATAGGATSVIQTDRNRKFLNLAKDSYSLNGFFIQKKDFISGDFFSVIARLKGEGRLFDIVILDPPFFSVTSGGRVDLLQENERLINKVRPLVADGGTLITINNAVYLSGADYIKTLEKICMDGYLSIRELIPVPEEFIGYHRVGRPVTDPTPFNHSTKIAILNVRRKS